MSITPVAGDTIELDQVPGQHVIWLVEPHGHRFLAWLGDSSHATTLTPGEFRVVVRASPAPAEPVELNEEERAVLAAVLAPSSEDINIGGIHSDAWSRLQELFPVELFRAWAEKHGDPYGGLDGTEEGSGYDPEEGIGYDPDAGM